MDDIEALQSHLDRVPDDHTARLVLADRLEEAGSPLAEGYRALALLGRHAHYDTEEPDAGWSFHSGEGLCSGRLVGVQCSLPKDWFAAVSRGGHYYWSDPRESRREAEDAAAEAFARLPESRRRELLAKLYGG